MSKEQSKGSIYPHVIPEIEDWPIYKLSEDRKNFVSQIDDLTFRRLEAKYGEKISDVIARTIYMERIRIKEEPWKVDPPNEKVFWKRIQRKLVKNSLSSAPEIAKLKNEEILQKIIHRYSEEIVGTFKIKTFLFARKFLTMFFNRLLNTAAGRNIHRIFGTRHRLQDKLLIKGEIDLVRKLIKKGTVVILPTHFSNLDSILIGYAMDSFAGLPSFSYGAGLNLYNTGYTAYFMNRLGAYRVDRRKKNPIYLECLKAMSSLSIQRGVNSLFFPGGTRSREGNIEKRLKLGLLSTVMEAQRTIYENKEEQKVFVVPLVLSYHFVLEAKYLIEQHLRRTGKERYIKTKDEFYSIRKNLKFLWQFFSASSEITLSFGKPMDVLGNFVDEDGVSFDSHGKVIEVKDYFMGEGNIRENRQRESEYTRLLAEKLVDRFHAENIVLSSHLVAFAAFKILERQNPNLDLYGILRLPADDYIFPKEILIDVIEQLKKALFALERAGKIKLSEEIYFDNEALLENGISKIGTYHTSKPLAVTKKGQIISESFHLLFYYHNRLENYDLHGMLNWKTSELELANVMDSSQDEDE
jgi:glycerol-3-phosphate O-acyltransferase